MTLPIINCDKPKRLAAFPLPPVRFSIASENAIGPKPDTGITVKNTENRYTHAGKFNINVAITIIAPII